MATAARPAVRSSLPRIFLRWRSSSPLEGTSEDDEVVSLEEMVEDALLLRVATAVLAARARPPPPLPLTFPF